MLSAITAFVACITLLLIFSRNFMTCKACNIRHELLEKEGKDANRIAERQIAQLIKKHDIQFRMLREIIVHLDLPADKKAKILNMTDGNIIMEGKWAD